MTSLTGNMGPRSRKGISQNDKIPSGSRAYQMQQYTPEQMEMLNQGYESVGPDSYTSRLAAGDEGLFDEMEAPAHRQFAEQQGRTASRFSAGGDLGARRSSGFQNEMSAAGSNFAQDLQSQRQSLQRQAIGDLHNMRHSLMGERPYDRWVENKREKQGTGWGSIAGGVIGAVGGGFVGGPAGAYAGYQGGSAIGGAFDKGGGRQQNASLSGMNLPNSWGGLGGGGGGYNPSSMDQMSNMANSVYGASY